MYPFEPVANVQQALVAGSRIFLSAQIAQKKIPHEAETVIGGHNHIETSPATRLYTPKRAKGETRAMSDEQVKTAVAAVDLREQVLLHMAISSGFRPGELLALQRLHVAPNVSVVSVEQRVYRGDLDDPKTRPSRRMVAIPPRTAELLRAWMESAVGPEPEAYVFAGGKGKSVWRDTLL